jgi:hypothetical protein
VDENDYNQKQQNQDIQELRIALQNSPQPTKTSSREILGDQATRVEVGKIPTDNKKP